MDMTSTLVCTWKTIYSIPYRRRPQIYIANGRQPNFILNGRQPQFFVQMANEFNSFGNEDEFNILKLKLSSFVNGI